MFDKILVIILDSCRFDTFTAAKTPNFSHLGRAIPAHTTSNWTPTSFIAFLGHGQWLQPSEHFENINISVIGVKLPPPFRQDLNWMKNFKNYYNVFITGMPWLSPVNSAIYGIMHYFHLYCFEKQIQILEKAAQLWNRKIKTKEKIFFVAWAGETHQPYNPPGRHETVWRAEAITLFNQGVDAFKHFEGDYLKYLKQRQIKMVEYCDTVFAKFDIPDGTFVLITADHGESFGENHKIGHGHDIHPVQFTVPLLWGVWKK